MKAQILLILAENPWKPEIKPSPPCTQSQRQASPKHPANHRSPPKRRCQQDTPEIAKEKQITLEMTQTIPLSHDDTKHHQAQSEHSRTQNPIKHPR